MVHNHLLLSSAGGTVNHRYEDLIALFNRCFEAEYQTRLVKGGDEPIYLPADGARSYHAIYFAHGFYSSALHECAHWFVAGPQRRLQEDFGYWYEPDGRSTEQQALFQQFEVKPQAIEWILSEAVGYRFQVSLDNLNGENPDSTDFKQAIVQQVKTYCKTGLPYRAARFRQVLCEFYKTPIELKIEPFLARCS
jgi:elongation factor P hydroxylase